MSRAVFLLAVLAFTGSPAPAQSSYKSPYRIEYATPVAELTADLDRTDRGDPHQQSSIPFRDWYAPRTLERWRTWGPPAAYYPPPAGLDRWTVEQKRERVIAVAMRYQGYAYQHHHVPDWSPPADWPWNKTCAPSNGKGVDCSNYTGFVYNLAFGLRLNTDIRLQSEQRTVKEGGLQTRPLHLVDLPASYPDRLKALRTGDLLFVAGKPGGPITHVVLWVGPIGRSPDGAPLVLDSHGQDTRDSNKTLIPCGVHLRPYRENSWYHRSAHHALRLFPDDPTPASR